MIKTLFVFKFYAECLEVNSLLDITHIRTTFKDGVKKLKEQSIKATDDKEKELIQFLDGNINKLIEFSNVLRTIKKYSQS